MTESNIFEILLNPNKSQLININYPQLQRQTTNLIAEKFTEIIYDSLKNKSNNSTTKRLNILKFLQNLSCNSRNNHLSINDHNYGVFLEFIDDNCRTINEFEANTLRDYQELPTNLCADVVRFNRLKNERNRNRIERLKSIRKHDEIKESNSILFRHELSDDFIKNLLNYKEIIAIDNRNDCDYREKQIKFCYALLNLNEFDKLQRYCQQIGDYKDLESFEIDFIKNLTISLRNDREFIDFLYKTFGLLYKKQLIELCTKLLTLQDFTITLHDYEIFQIICLNNHVFIEFNNLLSQLYVYSYCNENLLKFQRLLFEI